MSGLLFFKQKTAYEMRISDWSADGCSSDLLAAGTGIGDEHSDDHLPAGLKPLHRIGDMAAAALFGAREDAVAHAERSEEHTSELQSLMRISYAVFCLKKKKKIRQYRYGQQ